MQCLKCENEAVHGKALCVRCLEIDTARNAAEATPEWERSVVDATRESFSKRPLDGNFAQERFGMQVRNALSKFFMLMAGLLLGYWVLTQPASTGQVWKIFDRKTPTPASSGAAVRRRPTATPYAETPTAVNFPPDIRITSPAHGALFSSTNPISFVAIAADPDGTITSVRFIKGKEVLCAVYQPPYRCAWIQVDMGTHTIHAEAFDNTGATTQSEPITIDVFAPLPGEGSFSFQRPNAGSSFLLDATGALINVLFRATFKSKMAATNVTATIPNGSCTTQGVNEVTGLCSLSEPGDFSIRLTATLTNGAEVSGTLPVKAVRAPVTDGSQLNPYYSADELPLGVKDWGAPHADAPIDTQINLVPENERLFLYMNPNSEYAENRPFGAMAATSEGRTGGSFDDVISLQNSEITPPLQTIWSSSWQPTKLATQAAVILGTSASPVKPYENRLSKYGVACLANRGITFNSVYRHGGGHSITMSTMNQSSTVERDSFFQNTLQTTPSGRSYSETSESETVDSYDSLFTHLLTTIGEAGSDLPAITKLSVAGSALSPDVKRRLKASGNYAAALQWLWRAALPYSDGTGRPLPFEHELRHRPAYLANGELRAEEWLRYNASYHQYNEALHMHEMLRLASSFSKSTPPVTVMSLVDYSVTALNGQILETSGWDVGRGHIKLMLPTTARVWAKEGERVSLRINLAASYDLFGEPLTYHVSALYPEQSSLLEIKQESPSQFIVSASYSSRFPRGRIPVIATARNRTLSGAPAFITFLWPHESVSDTSLRNFFNLEDQSTHVNRNRRPMISASNSEPVTTKVGDTVKLQLSCSDPEGFATSWSRWAGEPGTLNGSEYELPVGPELRGRTIKLHFICSDGTGAYNSIERTITVAQ